MDLGFERTWVELRTVLIDLCPFSSREIEQSICPLPSISVLPSFRVQIPNANPSMMDQMNGLCLISAADSKDDVNRPRSLLSFYLSPLSVKILRPCSTSHSPTSDLTPVPSPMSFDSPLQSPHALQTSKHYSWRAICWNLRICWLLLQSELGKQVEILTRASLTGTFVDSISNYLTVWGWIWRLRFAIEMRMEVEGEREEEGGREFEISCWWFDVGRGSTALDLLQF